MLKAGTYTEAMTTVSNQFDGLPAGLGPGRESKIMCEIHQACEIKPSSGISGSGLALLGRPYMIVGGRNNGLHVNLNNVTISATKNVNGIRLNPGSMTTNTPGVQIVGNLVEGNNCFGISVNSSTGTGIWDGVIIAYNKVLRPRTPSCGTEPGNPDSPAHALYVSGVNLWIHHNSLYMWNANTDFVTGYGFSYAIQHYGYARNSLIEDNIGFAEGYVAGLIISDIHGVTNAGHMIRRNVFVRVGTGPAANDVCIDTLGGGDNNKWYNNTCIGFRYILENVNGSTANELRNNICYRAAGACQLLGNLAGVTQGTNNLNVATSVFTNFAGGDYTLSSSAGSLINGGVDIGLPFNGAAPDLGAFETFQCSSASINTNVLDITCAMSDKTPVQVNGTGGWTVNCTGTGCGTPAVSSVSVPTGSSTIIRLVISGITGGNCAVGQTWTWSYNSATGSVSNTQELGGTYNQPLHSASTQATTTICTGGGGGGPTGQQVYYKFDGNANDSSGNGLTGTVTGGSYVAGKYGSAFSTVAGLTDTFQFGYGNAIDPSSTSLTISGGIFALESDLATTRILFGTPLSGVDRRLYISRQGGNFRLGIQAYSAASASEFTVQAGWNHVCLVMDSATDTATLWVNGVAGVSSGAVRPYTSYTTTGNFFAGLPTGFAASSNGSHLFDEWKVWNTVQNCNDIYMAWEPATSPWIGNLAMVSARIYGAKLDSLGVRVPFASVNTDAFVPEQGAFAVLKQTDCTIANCSPIAERLYYKCALCPSGNTELTVPDSATSDGIEFYGSSEETGLLTGDHGALLSGALSRIPGTTLTTSDGIPLFDLAQNQSIVNGYIVRFNGAAVDRKFCFYVKEQTGVALNSVTPSGGICVTVIPSESKRGY